MSPLRRTSLHIFFSVAALSTYPSNPLEGWFLTIFPTNSPVSPGLQTIAQPVAGSRTTSPFSSTRIKRTGYTNGNSTEANPTEPGLLSMFTAKLEKSTTSYLCLLRYEYYVQYYTIINCNVCQTSGLDRQVFSMGTILQCIITHRHSSCLRWPRKILLCVEWRISG